MTPALQSMLRSRHWQSGLALILLVTLVRLVYLVLFCPYTLIEDEAHYWEWSRRLELSYYSKGPGIAWVIRAATQLLGTHEWAVRLPAVVFSGLGAFCAAGLARDMCSGKEGGLARDQEGGLARDQGRGLSSPHHTQGRGLSSPHHTQGRGLSSPRHNVGLYAAAIYLCMPAFWVLGIIITIDGPYLACWAAACWAAWRAVTTGSPRAWAALGLALAAGFLFKYTVLLLVPGLLIAGLLARRKPRALSVSAGPSAETPEHNTPPPLTLGAHSKHRALVGVVIAIACASLGLIPVILWNAQHDWITVQHLLGHLGVRGGDIAPNPGEHWSPLWTLELLGIQVGLAGPAMLLAVYAFVCARREREADPDTWRAARFLACCGLPVLVFYVLVSFVAEPEGNWPLAAWVSAAPLGAIGIAGALPIYRRRVAAWRDAGKPGIRPHMNRVMMWRWTLGAGVIAALGFARADLMVKVPYVGPLVPKGRLMFADVRAADATGILDDLRSETGLEPVVMAQHYGRTSQLAYYLPDRPVVYCAGAYMEGPRKQYDLWPVTDLSNPDTHARLAGRPALLVGGRFEQWVPAFARVVEVGQLEGEHKTGRLIYLGYEYHGFPASQPSSAAGLGGRAIQSVTRGLERPRPCITGGRAFQPATEPTARASLGAMLSRQRKHDASTPAGSSLALRALASSPALTLRAHGEHP